MRVPLLLVLAACADGGGLDVSEGGTVDVAASPMVTAASFAAPVRDPARISSTFGPRRKTSDGGRYEFHAGVDYFDEMGAPVLAIGDGVVHGVYPEGSSEYPLGGNVLVIRHPLPAPSSFAGRPVDRIYAVYLHLDSFAVAAGEPVRAGEPVGTMGMSGETDFVHLHFEIRVQTPCSLAFQLANPTSGCVTGFDPHVHPFLFVGGRNDDAVTVTALPAATGYAVRYQATRGDLDLDRVETDLGTVGFVERAGMDARSREALDSVDFGFLRLDPGGFGSGSSDISYDLLFPRRPAFIELRDIHGRGVRFGRRAP